MDPSKRVNKNPHTTPACQGCMFENQDDPTERPCYQCVRKEMIIDSDLTFREIMAHYKEYYEEEKTGYQDYYKRRNE